MGTIKYDTDTKYHALAIHLATFFREDWTDTRVEKDKQQEESPDSQ